ncbi:unnamed protein product [Caenorhabditis auriculariae]|uniref:Nuclear receptor domain-containing protein n=1 Tax=Caenorhabditis auriculariae TaxID=2777116 RepID=A0A8S1HGU5_9PELO|nr:unnamed protein product [Caenorhabditis auriculariae]
MLICAICNSTATSLHFGAASCKACAAFFRRTVALNIEYECIEGTHDCEIHHGIRSKIKSSLNGFGRLAKRMACKKCRYEKCLRSNMLREFVQSKGKRGPEPKEISENVQDYQSPSTSQSPIEKDQKDQECRAVREHYIKLESTLNRSRKLLFTESRILDIFSGLCIMPFEKSQLRPFDFRTFQGFEKQEYVIMFNYAASMLAFDKLCSPDQNFLFRMACGVDFILNSAFYTCQLGIEHNFLVSQDGRYILMVPQPLTGDEPGAGVLFPKKEDLEKYQNIVQPRYAFWRDFVPRFHDYNLTFEEFTLLKAMSIWKAISSQQQELLFRTLLNLCEETCGEDGATRAGNLVLFLTVIHEEVMELIHNLVLVTLFDFLNSDKVLTEIIDLNSVYPT